MLENPPSGELLADSPSGDDSPIWDALRQAGVTRNRRTERLSRLPHLTPGYIHAHHLALQQAGKGDHTGLLITLLESAEPAPELNANRHLASCACLDCQRLLLLACPVCSQYPCQC